METIAAFFSGLILLNAVPHLVCGICGKKHMTPFSSESSALVNVMWGWMNLVAGSVIAVAGDFRDWDVENYIAFAAGGFITSVSLALLWSKEGARLPWHRKGQKPENRQSAKTK